MTERMASGWMTLRLDNRELKRFGKTQSRWWKQTVQLWGDITMKAKKCKSRR